MSNSFGIFEMPPRIGILMFSNTVKVYMWSRCQNSCSLFTFPKKHFGRSLHFCVVMKQPLLVFSKKSLGTKDLFVNFSWPDYGKYYLSQRSTPPLGMWFWWGVPNSARAMNEMVHHSWLLLKVVCHGSKTVLSSMCIKEWYFFIKFSPKRRLGHFVAYEWQWTFLGTRGKRIFIHWFLGQLVRLVVHHIQLKNHHGKSSSLCKNGFCKKNTWPWKQRC
jgi:hypothetical protein